MSKCEHCEFLDRTFGKIFKRKDFTNREYWLFTEIFSYLHGGDKCKKQIEMTNLTAKEIAKKYASSIGGKGLGSARFDLSEECEKEIINYAKQEVGKKTEEFEMRLYIQKVHCKLFHRQKISIWFMNIYYKLKWWIKPVKIK